MADGSLEEYYRQRAPEYEQIYYRDMPQRRQEIDGEASFLRRLAAGREVLDLACGTGYWTQVLAGAAGSVVASDLSEEMLREAGRKEYDKKPLWVRADLEHLPFAAGSFELVTLGFWFSHQSRHSYGEFFERIKRLVRRGGQVWMIDNNPPAEGPTLHSAGFDEHGNNLKTRYLDNGREFVILKNYFEARELREVFEPHFEIERLRHREYYWSVLLSC